MLTIDYANCLAERVGEHGLEPASLADRSQAADLVERLTAEFESTRETGWERWRGLPIEPMRSEHLAAVQSLTERLRGEFDNLVVLGIGGSALGNIALQSALSHPQWNLLPREKRRGPRLFVVDNVDPTLLGGVLDVIETHGGVDRTLFNVISKSGETAETAAQFLTIRQRLIDALGEKAHAEHVVAITDPEKGTMRAICDEAGYETLPVPEGVGGRFSVLSPVGLFSAAMCGVDIESLLDGAAEMDERCARPRLTDNPAAFLATLLLRLAKEKGKTQHVLMPYANGLYLLADWFRQLWAESLGKSMDLDGAPVHAGYTPIKALGATDQHSQIQLYREGPNDKVIGFMQVDEFPSHDELAIPGLEVHNRLAYLHGARFRDLLNAEKRATEFALVESRRPNFTIRFPRIDAHHIGQFINLWQIATAYAGRMLNIDPYNQPAVETGKLATFGLMGRPGYEDQRERTDKVLTQTDYIV